MKYKVVNKQFNYDQCVVCGYHNPFSMNAEFYELENNEVVSFFYTIDQHQSYPERTHGGLISAILDETIGRAIKCYEPDAWGVTVELTTKFKKPVPLNTRLMCAGRIVENRSRMYVGTGELYLPDGQVAATAEVKYVKQTPQKITNIDIEALGLTILPDKEEITEVELYDDNPENIPFHLEK